MRSSALTQWLNTLRTRSVPKPRRTVLGVQGFEDRAMPAGLSGSVLADLGHHAGVCACVCVQTCTPPAAHNNDHPGCSNGSQGKGSGGKASGAKASHDRCGSTGSAGKASGAKGSQDRGCRQSNGKGSGAKASHDKCETRQSHGKGSGAKGSHGKGSGGKGSGGKQSHDKCDSKQSHGKGSGGKASHGKGSGGKGSNGKGSHDMCGCGDTVKVKGNNGVGNGLDPQPPGNPRVNDGPGTSPGTPGNRGGK